MSKPKAVENPKCEDCGVPMYRYAESPDTGSDGWVCPDCGWSLDDDPPRRKVQQMKPEMTTHKTPSPEAVKAAEELMSRVFDDCTVREGCTTKGLHSDVALIIDRHFAGLREVKEAADGVRLACPSKFTNCDVEELEHAIINLRAALSAVEKGKVGE